MPIAVPFLTGHKQLSIELAEPVVLLRGSPTDPVTQVLRGEVHLFLSKPMTAQQTTVKLIGKSKMTWPEGLGARRSKVHHEKTIFERDIVLDLIENQLLPAGLNRWSFEFLIPNSVVETIEDEMATVKYYIVANVQRPGIGTLNLKSRRNILLLRTLSGSEDTFVVNPLLSTSVVAERKTDFCDASIFIEKSTVSSGTQFPISIVMTAQKKNIHLEAINVILTEKRVYRVPEYNAKRVELYDFKLKLVSVMNMADVEQMNQAMVPSSEFLPQQIRRVITTKNAHIPLGSTPFQFKFMFSLPNCLALNHSTHYKEMNFLHHLKLDIEVLTEEGTNDRQHIYLETPITVLDCRLKEDFTTLPTYQQSLSDTTIEEDDDLLRNKLDGFFVCPCYMDYKKKIKDKSGKESMLIRQQNATTSSLASSNIPPPDYNTLNSKI